MGWNEIWNITIFKSLALPCSYIFFPLIQIIFLPSVPLLHVLGFHSKILSGGGDSSIGGVGSGLHWIRQTWASITQQPVAGSEGAVTPREREVPLLLRDPVTLLLQLILLLPSRIDQGKLTITLTPAMCLSHFKGSVGVI